jgi:hypothetical protein
LALWRKGKSPHFCSQNDLTPAAEFDKDRWKDSPSVCVSCMDHDEEIKSVTTKGK